MAVRTIPLTQISIPDTQDYYPGLKIANQIPQVFIRLQRALDLSTFSANDVLAKSPLVPEGFIGKTEDFNINIATTGTAVIALVILDAANNILSTVLDNITSSSSGFGAVVLPNQRIAAIVLTAGTGTLRSVDISGTWTFIGDNPP